MATVQIKKSGGKKIKEARIKVDQEKTYEVTDAIALLKELSFTKFDQTLEVVMNLGVDPRHSDQMVRGVTVLPAGTGKDVKVAVICKDEKVSEALAAGADAAGSAEVIDDIKAGKINFDIYIATPDMMGVVGQVARILGPKGKMPNPKTGTVTPDVKTAVKNAKSGQVEFRVEKAGIIHAGIGKLSFADTDLQKNVDAIVSAIIKAKPSGAKGTYLKSMYLTSTMGPSVKVAVSDIK
ncbi:MAG: rplA [Rickettsiaceae bacterium]|jgi:large subunit ribosomal protein L1|nr:rplA [Rickettsiaceae bacterium]